MHEQRIENAWLGRIAGCQLGKPVERLSMQEGFESLTSYLQETASLPVRDYIAFQDHPLVDKACCRGFIQRAEPDDDINYSLLALMMLETHGRDLKTVDVARFWLRHLPVGKTYTAERAAYRILLERGKEWFPEGAQPGFDLAECSDNPFNEWIGAQIRADVYGWVCPGDPEQAANFARQDAGLSHRGEGVLGAVFVAALGALLAEAEPNDAFAGALEFLPEGSDCRTAALLGKQLADSGQTADALRARYGELSPVHTVNNLGVVVWALFKHLDDFTCAIGEAVGAGWDTDCNGATVGGLWGIRGEAIPTMWTDPWHGRVGFGLAGLDELPVEQLVERTINVYRSIGSID